MLIISHILECVNKLMIRVKLQTRRYIFTNKAIYTFIVRLFRNYYTNNIDAFSVLNMRHFSLLYNNNCLQENEIKKRPKMFDFR